MPSSRNRPQASRLALRLDALSRPLALIAPSGEIEFANRALAEWLGASASDLVGTTCRYHSQPASQPAEFLAAAICPPPEAFAGRAVEAVVHVPSMDGARRLAARAQFVPLHSEATAGPVLALFAPTAEAEWTPASASEATVLHAELQRFRQRAYRNRTPTVLGVSPAMRRVEEQIDLATACSASVLLVASPASQARRLARELHARGPATLLLPLDAPRVDAEMIRELLSPRTLGSESTGVTLLCLEADRLTPDAQLELETCLRTSPIKLRLLSTSACPLEQLVRAQEFRADLASRMSTITIEIPPLAERLVDLPLVAQGLVEELNADGEKQLGGFTSEALDRLAEHSWPGDVEELAEVVRESFAQSVGPLIALQDLPPRLLSPPRATTATPRRGPLVDLEQFLAELETEMLRRALALAKGNKTEAAQLLGMTRPRFYRRLVQCGLEQPAAGEQTDDIDWQEVAPEDSPADSGATHE